MAITEPESAAKRSQHLERLVFDLTSLLKAGRALNNILNPAQLYEVLVAIVAEKLDAGPLALFVYDKESKICKLVQTHQLPDIEQPFDFTFEEGLLWQNVLQYEPFPVTSPSGQPLYEQFFARHQLEQLQSLFWVPLFLRDQFIGLLTVGGRPDERDYDLYDREFLKQFAATAAPSINTCLLYVKREEESAELTRTFRNLSMLYNISRAMTHISDLKQLLGYILEQATSVADAKKGSIMLLNHESGELEIRVIEGLADPEVQAKINNYEIPCRTFKPGEGVAGTVYQSGKPQILNSTGDPNLFVGGGDSFVDSICCVPMKVYGEVIGVINVTNKNDGSDFTEEDTKLLEAIADQAAVAINKAQLWEMSVTDSLTELHIRRYMLAVLNDELIRSHRFGHSLSVVMCDIDHFKNVNDTYGHDVGDIVLREIAQIFKSEARTIDHVARFGGEEFVLLLIETDKENGMMMADRLRARIEAHEVKNVPKVTLSLGVATYPVDGEEIEDLLKRADLALYHAKHSGRNRVAGFTPRLLEQHDPEQADES